MIILQIAIYMAIGATLGTAGLSWKNWQFFAVLFLVMAADLLSAYRHISP